MVIKLILILIIIFAIFKAVLRYRERIISLHELILWLLFWFLAIFLVIFPEITSYMAVMVGVGRGADLVIYLSILILFYLVFRGLTKLDKIEKDITAFVRKEAIENELNKKNESR